MTETITIRIIPRDSDYVFVTSDDVPGLYLWGPPETVYSDLEPVIRDLYRSNRGIEVTEIRALDATETERTLQIDSDAA
jgi:hypothetical protein